VKVAGPAESQQSNRQQVRGRSSVAEPVDQLIGSGSDLPNRLRIRLWLHAKRTGSDRLRLRLLNYRS